MAPQPSSIGSPGFRPFKWALGLSLANVVLTGLLLAVEHEGWVKGLWRSQTGSMALIGAEVGSLTLSLLLLIVAVRRGTRGIRIASILLALPVIAFLVLIARGPG